MRVDTNGMGVSCYDQPDESSNKIGKFSNRTKLTVLGKTKDGKFYKVTGISMRREKITGYVLTYNLRK